MANAIYPLYKQSILAGDANVSLTGGTLKAALVDTGVYTYSAAHQFLTSLTGVVGTAGTVATVTVANGLIDGDNVVYSAVSGNTAEAIVLYLDTGVPGTSRLVAYIDTGVTGLPVTPNGGDINLNWNASGIVQL